jgi:hypothetical protein
MPAVVVTAVITEASPARRGVRHAVFGKNQPADAGGTLTVPAGADRQDHGLHPSSLPHRVAIRLSPS